MNQAFIDFPEIEEVLIFGSRAMGNFKSGSDIDLAVKGEKVEWETIVELSTILNERQPIPYHFDITDYKSVDNDDLQKHIDQYGKVIYSKSNQQ